MNDFKAESTGRERLNWPETALRLAFDIAKYRSQDPFVQVGAVAIKVDGSLVVGYNGAPSGINIDWSDRDERRKRVLHAEANVLNFIKPKEASFLAVTHLPCSECIKLICQKQIRDVYYSFVLDGYNNELSYKLAEEFNIKLHKKVIEKQLTYSLSEVQYS